MKCDVAVLGGGPGGYTAAIRAAQLGASVICIEQAEALGGTCLRVGCIPTKAWVQTAHFLHQARDSFGKLGVVGRRAATRLSGRERVEVGGRLPDDGRDRIALQGKRRRVGARHGHVPRREARSRSRVARTSSSARRSSPPARSRSRPPIPGLDSELCVDSTGLLAQTEVPRRLVILGGGIIGCEFASIFGTFGSEVTIVEMLERLIPQEDEDAANELAKAFRKRAIALELGKQCTGVEQSGGTLTVRYGDGESVEADLMLVVGRPCAARLGPRARGGRRRLRHAQGDRSRRPPPHLGAAHLRRRRLRRVLAARPHRFSRGRGCGRERLRP